MDFVSIMHEITFGLTGDAQEDMAYIKGQMEKYKNYQMSKEILSAC